MLVIALGTFYPLFNSLGLKQQVVKQMLFPLIFIHLEKWKWKSLSHVWLFVTPWIVAHQAPLSMGFSRQEYWIG